MDLFAPYPSYIYWGDKQTSEFRWVEEDDPIFKIQIIHENNDAYLFELTRHLDRLLKMSAENVGEIYLHVQQL